MAVMDTLKPIVNTLKQVTLIPAENRAYKLIYLTMFATMLLAGYTLYQQPNQWSHILNWWQEASLWILGIGVGMKEGGKGLRAIGNLIPKRQGGK